jgi:hypothetical protein
MLALHMSGGVPPNWEFSPPAGDAEAGRKAFVDFGCPSCHRVEGEAFTKETGPDTGPDLTDMGSHHPPAYFAESILSPDAVLVTGPGYVGPDGHSTMPEYPDMTIQQVGDLVAYLASLTSWGPVSTDHSHSRPGPKPPLTYDPPPAGAPDTAGAFLVQSYDVNPGQLEAFETWFSTRAAPRLRAIDGLVAVDTDVDFTLDEKRYTTTFAFRDMTALQRFLDDPTAQALGREFDGFVGEHTSTQLSARPIYRVTALSTP